MRQNLLSNANERMAFLRGVPSTSECQNTRVTSFDGVTIRGWKRGKHEMAARCNQEKFWARCFVCAYISLDSKVKTRNRRSLYTLRNMRHDQIKLVRVDLLIGMQNYIKKSDGNRKINIQGSMNALDFVRSSPFREAYH